MKEGKRRSSAPFRGVLLLFPIYVYVRRCPTLPHRLRCSTIGAGGLNFRVRNGTGCFPTAMTTETLKRPRTRTPAVIDRAGVLVFQGFGSRSCSGNRIVNASRSQQ